MEKKVPTDRHLRQLLALCRARRDISIAAQAKATRAVNDAEQAQRCAESVANGAARSWEDSLGGEAIHIDVIWLKLAAVRVADDTLYNARTRKEHLAGILERRTADTQSAEGSLSALSKHIDKLSRFRRARQERDALQKVEGMFTLSKGCQT